MIGWEDPFDVQDPTDDDDILAAYGDALRNGLLVALAMPTVCARRETAQTINDATDTGIAADVLDYDSHAIHSVVGGVSRFTVPAGGDGEWEPFMGTRWQTNNNGQRRSYIRISGPTYGTKIVIAETVPTGWSGACEQHVSRPIQAASGDYFEFFVWHDAGSTPGTSTPGASLDLQPLDLSAQVIGARWVRLPHTVAAA